MIYIGIDPGKKGAIVILDTAGLTYAVPYEGMDTPMELLHPRTWSPFAVLEKATAGHKQGVTSNFSFGENYGAWRMALHAGKISHQIVTAQTWQKVMIEGKPSPPARLKEIKAGLKYWKGANDAKSKALKKEKGRLKAEHKKAIKAYAAEVAVGLFPNVDFHRGPKSGRPHEGVVDAILIAEYARRLKEGGDKR